MSQVRDNVTSNATLQVPENLEPTQDPQGVQGQPLPIELTQAQMDRRRAEREKDYQDQQQNIQADFVKKMTDPPGYGSNQTADSEQLKKNMLTQGMSVPTAEQAQMIDSAVGQTPEFQDAVKQIKDALNGEGPVPTNDQMNALLQKITSNPNFPSQAVNSTRKDTASAEERNVTAVVMLVILRAQQENTKEKGDILLKIKMYNGMLDALNTYVSNNLMSAQKELQNLMEQGKGKKNFSADTVQVPVDAMSNLDTKNASMDQNGQLVLNAQWGDGTGSSRQMVNSTGLSNLISQADQWRTSIQNNQTQQSNRFQAKDNLMSSGWNILNAILKNSHDGVVNIVRNV